MLRCRICKSRPSERKGTPLFDVRLAPARVKSVLDHIAEGCGVRQTGEFCRMDRGTMARYSRHASDHACTINTAFIKREHGMAGHRNAPKARKSYRFSKDWQFHEAVTDFTMSSWNFC